MIRADPLLLAAGVALLAGPLAAQSARGTAGAVTPAPPPVFAPVIQAVRISGAEPDMDGRIDEAAWEAAALAGGFVQFEPDGGKPASQRTEARVLYGADALYVALRAFDTAPDSIVGQLTRRDQQSYSDQVAVLIDSYFDRRTAFQFAVNPVGVKNDAYLFDDVNDHSNWDAVWDVATTVDEQGWTAEFRIPYSQLRFREGGEQTWGINFLRVIARHQEKSVWAPTLRTEAAIVSKFGELRGLSELRPPRRLEVQPYTLGKLDRAPGEAENPFWSHNAFGGSMGADLKYGITSDLTLDVTINPDFGQVEADPSQVNLTAFETFLSERRPFFVEGRNLFSFPLSFGDGDGSAEGLFYSRRVGRAPQGSVDAGDGWSDEPGQTTILAASKLSGKTPSGWSLGILDAITSEESATLAPAPGARENVAVEPLSNYLVGRLSKDFRDGRSSAGAIVTAVARDRAVADAHDLRRRAYTGGLNTRHRFDQNRWEVVGYALGTHVTGSADAIARTQRSSARYFQRPDAGHLDYDTTRTSLSGASFGVQVSKISGDHWRFATALKTRSPGFEANDAGFMNETDVISSESYFGYRQSTPQGIFRRWALTINGWSRWSFGGEHYSVGGNVNGNFQLTNFWGGYGGLNYNGGALSKGFLRGGPAMATESNLVGWWGLESDSRKPVQLALNGQLETMHRESDSWNVRLSPSLTWRPSGRATVSLGASYNRNVNDNQWVGKVGVEPAYVLGHLDQSTVDITTRLDLAFTPTLSLQFYAQPFVSAGDYSDFKRVADPRAPRYADRFTPLAPRLAGDEYFADLKGDGSEESFGRPDFNLRQFHSNAVLRWEYRPGSVLYLVWAQGRDESLDRGAFDLSDELARPLFRGSAQCAHGEGELLAEPIA